MAHNPSAAVNTSHPPSNSHLASNAKASDMDLTMSMYDETDHEVEALLAGVVKPSEDPIATFDNYNPRAAFFDSAQGGQAQGHVFCTLPSFCPHLNSLASCSGLEGFMRGYQYQFASRGFPFGRRGVVPTLDDQGRLRLRRSQGPHVPCLSSSSSYV